MLGQVAGYRRQGKPRMLGFDSIEEATGLRLEKMAYASGRKDSEQGTHKCEMNSGEGNGKPLLNSKYPL